MMTHVGQDGWGVTHTGGEGSDLVISDGSSSLTVIDRTNFQRKYSVQVTSANFILASNNYECWLCTSHKPAENKLPIVPNI